jgi:ribonucleoside-triphosphate reductase
MLNGLEDVLKADTAKSTKVDCTQAVEEYIDKSDWRIFANANTSYSNAGLVNGLAGKVIANYWLDKVYSKKEGDAHRNGDYHIHDLDSLSGYCCGHDLQRLLNEGFNGVVGRVSSKAPKHFREALYQMANFIGILQAEWAGAQAFSSFDTYLSPYVFFDMYYGNLDQTDVQKAILNFIYNLNVPSRWGQSPFSNLTIDWTIPADMSAQYPLRNDKNYFRTIYEDLLDEEKVKFNETVVIELKKRLEITEDISIDDLFDKVTYKLFQKEMNIINKAFYECLNKGDINGLPFTFPIPTVNITENFDWDGENTDLLFENAAKYGSSYFQNFIGSQYKRNENGELVLDDNAYKPSDVRSMCPLTGDTEILTLSGRGINNTQLYHLNEDEHQVLANGKWVKFKKINIGTGQKVYAVKLSNGLTVKMGENHLQPTQRGTVKCKDLIVGDLIPFNTDVITWSGETGSYLLGYAIGAYYGDGNKDSNGICYSLAVSDKDNETEEKLKTFWNSLGYKVTTNINDGVRKVRIGGNSFDLIARFISGDNANNKKMTSYSFSLTEEARNGIIDGYIAIDGNRTRKRISTSSEQMVNNLITLFTLQGKKALLSYTDTRDTRLGDKPNYIVSYPERDSYGDYYKTIDNVLYYSITEINEIEQQHLYCIEVEDDSHVFTLANGMTTHNCRLQLDKRELRKRGGGLFGSDAQTGSIGVVTINMARLGYLYKGNFPLLKKKLIHLMELAKSTLEKKRSFINELYLRGLYPYTRRYLKGFNTFFSTIGVNGMNEMVRNFSNDEYDITSYEGQKMCIELLDLIRSKMSNYQEETGNLYNLEATPAEGTTYRFAKEDIKRFPDIIHAGTEKEPYYTNSSQLPVNFTDDPFEALDKQDELQCKYTGGTVLHLYMTERLSNATACKNLIKKVLTNYRLPYISITPTYSICPIHGYIPGNHEFCPKCDQIILEEYAKEIDFNE